MWEKLFLQEKNYRSAGVRGKEWSKATDKISLETILPNWKALKRAYETISREVSKGGRLQWATSDIQQDLFEIDDNI